MDLLVVEEDSRISEFIAKGLEENGFTVVLANNGAEGRKLINQKEWDLILLDVMLSDTDGVELLQYTKHKRSQTPILAITSGILDDNIRAVDYGADDYLTIPFLFRDLLARINVLTDKEPDNLAPSNVLVLGNLKVYPDKLTAEREGKEIKLTSKELQLLKLLIENKGKVLTITQLLDIVWGINYDTNTNVVDVYMTYLKDKIDPEGQRKLIRTAKGRGYMIQSFE